MSRRKLLRRLARFERYALRYSHVSQPADPDLRLRGRAHARALQAVFADQARRHPGECVRCGCTDDRACPGGCSWVVPNVCSQCAPLPPGLPLITTIDTGGLL